MKKMSVRKFVLLLCVLGFAFVSSALPGSAQGILPPIMQKQPTEGTSFTVLNHTSCFGGNPATSCTTSSMSVTGGNGHALIALQSTCFGLNCNSTGASVSFAIADSNGGNTWESPAGALVSITIGGAQTYSAQVAYACNVAAGSYTFTSTPSGGTAADIPTLLVFEVAGVKSATGTGCADSAVTLSGSGSGANPSITSGTVSQASEFLTGGMFYSGAAVTANQTSVQTLDNGNGQANQEWTTGPASGTQAMSWTASAATAWVGAVIGLEHP